MKSLKLFTVLTFLAFRSLSFAFCEVENAAVSAGERTLRDAEKGLAAAIGTAMAATWFCGGCGGIAARAAGQPVVDHQRKVLNNRVAARNKCVRDEHERQVRLAAETQRVKDLAAQAAQVKAERDRKVAALKTSIVESKENTLAQIKQLRASLVTFREKLIENYMSAGRDPSEPGAQNEIMAAVEYHSQEIEEQIASIVEEEEKKIEAINRQLKDLGV